MNNQTKIELIKSESIEDLIVKVNRKLNETGVFASPITQDLIHPHLWYCFIYYRTLNTLESDKSKGAFLPKLEKVTGGSDIAPPVKSLKEFKPNERLLEKWKNQKPTIKTLNFLKKKHKLSDEEIRQIKTQYDAYAFEKSLEESYI